LKSSFLEQQDVGSILNFLVLRFYNGKSPHFTFPSLEILLIVSAKWTSPFQNLK